MKLGLLAILLVCLGCGGDASERAKTPGYQPKGDPVRFGYVAVDGEELSSGSVRGRATIMLFITTYDFASQLAARRVNELLRGHQPRINAGAIVMEPPKYAPLADTFKQSLGLRFPVAIADRALREGRGPFGRIRGVPTLIILDREGREAWRGEGAATSEQLKEVLAKVAGRGNAPRD